MSWWRRRLFLAQRSYPRPACAVLTRNRTPSSSTTSGRAPSSAPTSGNIGSSGFFCARPTRCGGQTICTPPVPESETDPTHQVALRVNWCGTWSCTELMHGIMSRFGWKVVGFFFLALMMVPQLFLTLFQSARRQAWGQREQAIRNYNKRWPPLPPAKPPRTASDTSAPARTGSGCPRGGKARACLARTGVPIRSPHSMRARPTGLIPTGSVSRLPRQSLNTANPTRPSSRAQRWSRSPDMRPDVE